MQDIVPPDGIRSIRRIAIPETKQKPEKARAEAIREVREEFQSARIRAHAPRDWKKYYYGLGALAVVILAVIISSLFHSATVSVSPKQLVTDIAASLIAKKDAGGADLPFTLATIKKTGSVTVKASGEEKVEKRASGVIVVYNNYSSAPQRLIKNTRFETPEGLIFRIDQSVTVPGKKGTLPGSIEATVYADEAGEKYNVGLKDFTIPGFKGDPRYAAFSAKSKPSAPLAGGFSGLMKVVSDADRKAAQAQIEKDLKLELMKQAGSDISGDLVLFDGAYVMNFVPLSQEAGTNNQVTIREEGTLSAYVFNKKSLSAAAAKVVIKDYKNEPILIENIEDLAFVPKKAIDPASDKEVSFTLSGNAHFAWAYDEASLKQALLGKSRSEVQAVIAKFPMLERVDISMSPFWRRSFPDDVAKISIKRAE